MWPALLNVCKLRESISPSIRARQLWWCPVHSTNIYRCQQQHCSRVDKPTNALSATASSQWGDAPKSLPGRYNSDSTLQLDLQSDLFCIYSAWVWVTLPFQLLGKQRLIGKVKNKRGREAQLVFGTEWTTLSQLCYLTAVLQPRCKGGRWQPQPCICPLPFCHAGAEKHRFRLLTISTPQCRTPAA